MPEIPLQRHGLPQNFQGAWPKKLDPHLQVETLQSSASERSPYICRRRPQSII